MYNRHQNGRSNRGFTLIELMIVIGIISVLASIVLPSFRASKVKTQRTSCQENLKTIATAYFMYRANTSNGTATIGPLVLVPKYLPRLPVCPLGAGSYDGGVMLIKTDAGDVWTQMFYCNWNHGIKGVTSEKVGTYSQGLYWTEVTGIVTPEYQ